MSLIRQLSVAFKPTLIIIALLAAINASAQINPREYSMHWFNAINDTLPSILTAARQEDRYFLNEDYKNKTLDSLFHDEAFCQHRPTGTYYVQKADTSAVHFFVRRITSANYAQYEFRILVNASATIVPWTPVPYNKTTIEDPDKKAGNLHWLGAWKAGTGNYLVIDLRKKGSDKIISYAVVFWRRLQPVVLNIYTAAELNELIKKLSTTQSYTLSDNEIKKWRAQYSPGQLDTVSFLPKKLVLQPDNNNLIFLLRSGITKKDQVEYQLRKNNEIYTDWKTNDLDRPLIWLRDMPPGQYQLNIRYAIQRDLVTSYSFEIKKNWYQTFAFKITEGILIAAFLGFILLLWLNYRQKRMIRAEQQKKEKLENDIRALRVQLNPHFIFNALGSIQGLVNNGETDSASNYLSDFANLMRDVLNEKNTEYNVLEQEIQILESYLKLEQLRFRFRYNITVPPTLQPSAIQVPALLLQPLVENAVKHGVASLQEKGQIDISFEHKGNDLFVHIADNGPGFDTANTPYGYGLQLTKRRIAFTNEISGSQAIFMKIHSGRGTFVTITYQNWLA